MASSAQLPQFFVGQRCISTTEVDLGLGIITQADVRRLEVLFPASDEARTYSRESAPIARIEYEAGDTLQHEDGWLFTVERVELRDNILEYHGVDEAGSTVRLLETRLAHEIQIVQAKDRLMAAQTDPHAWFEMRYQTLVHREKLSHQAHFGLSGARVDTIRHQLNIAAEVGKRIAPRVLLADEVGLGKTIEAGLILHYQLLNNLAHRAIIVLPESLLHQWLVEMLRRFNLRFSIFDQSRWEASEEEFEENNNNPFSSEQLVLTTIEFLTSNTAAINKAKEAEWDILIVDEAHHLHWSEQEVSSEYAIIEQLAQTTPGVLLLTATPEQLGIESHFARLRLLDPDRFYNLEQFLAEESSYESVAQLANKLIDRCTLTDADIETLSSMTHIPGAELADLNKEITEELDTESSKETGLSSNARQQTLNRLIDRHGTSRLFFRNTRSNIAGFPQRGLHSYPMDLPEIYSESAHSLYPNVGLDEELWTKEDPRVEKIAELLKDREITKLVVICAHRETAEALEMYLRLRRGYRSAVFHEGLSLIERDRAAAYFSDIDLGARMLICSEIGSEGRNFQFAHHLFLFDLPKHPDLLEQRIGRLDRIGQKHDIKIHVPYFKQTAQENVFRWYNEGLNGFEETCPDGEFVLQSLNKSVDDLSLLENADFDAVLTQSQSAHSAIKHSLQQGRDRLLELNSSGELSDHQWSEEIEETYDSYDLENYLSNVLDCFGMETEEHSENTWVIKPSENMTVSSFPAIPEEGVTATFSRETALAREDMEFVTWEHPMIQGAFDLILNNETGNSSLAALKNKNVKSGTLFLECIFSLQVVAAKRYQANRYLPKQLIRVLTSDGKTDLASSVAHETLNKQLEKVNHKIAKKLIPQIKPQIQPLYAFCEQAAEAQSQSIAQESLVNLKQETEREIDRLEELAKVNPNVRQTELDFQKQKLEELAPKLEQVQLNLDCIRLIVAA